MESVDTSLIPVEKQDRLEKALEFCQSLKEVKINTQEQYDNAVALCKQVKSGITSLEADRKELVKPYKDKSKKIDTEYKSVRDDLENAERVLKGGMGVFYRAQEAKRLEDQRKREAEAEEARRKAEAKAEAERLKAEKYAAEGRAEMAEKAEARAQTAEATASTITAPVVENTAKASGVSYRTVYKVSVINHQRAIGSLSKNEMFHQYLSIDISGLEKVVNASKGKLALPDGLLVTEDVVSSVRS